MTPSATKQSAHLDMFETDRLAERVEARAFDRALTDVGPLIHRAVRAERRARLALYFSVVSFSGLVAGLWLFNRDVAVAESRAMEAASTASRQQDQLFRQREELEQLSRDVALLRAKLEVLGGSSAPGVAYVPSTASPKDSAVILDARPSVLQ
jgi:hypothetical protein